MGRRCGRSGRRSESTVCSRGMLQFECDPSWCWDLASVVVYLPHAQRLHLAHIACALLVSPSQPSEAVSAAGTERSPAALIFAKHSDHHLDAVPNCNHFLSTPHVTLYPASISAIMEGVDIKLTPMQLVSTSPMPIAGLSCSSKPNNQSYAAPVETMGLVDTSGVPQYLFLSSVLRTLRRRWNPARGMKNFCLSACLFVHFQAWFGLDA